MYFDSHAHLDDAHFDGDRAAILDDLKNHGVTMVMNVGCDLPSSERSVRLAEQYPFLYAAVGSHPDDAHPRATGVFHCFSGSPEMALWLVERGWYIGFTGVVTFKNARRAVEAVQALPLDRILIETDCPYMAPEPYRGRRNDSRYVPLVAAKIAALRGLTPEEAGALTAANARRLFRIPDGEEASACVTP